MSLSLLVLFWLFPCHLTEVEVPRKSQSLQQGAHQSSFLSLLSFLILPFHPLPLSLSVYFCPCWFPSHWILPMSTLNISTGSFGIPFWFWFAPPLLSVKVSVQMCRNYCLLDCDCIYLCLGQVWIFQIVSKMKVLLFLLESLLIWRRYSVWANMHFYVFLANKTYWV